MRVLEAVVRLRCAGREAALAAALLAAGGCGSTAAPADAANRAPAPRIGADGTRMV